MKEEELQAIRERAEQFVRLGTTNSGKHYASDVPKLLDEIERLHQVFRDILNNIHNPYKTVDQSLREIDEIAHGIFHGESS